MPFRFEGAGEESGVETEPEPLAAWWKNQRWEGVLLEFQTWTLVPLAISALKRSTMPSGEQAEAIV